MVRKGRMKLPILLTKVPAIIRRTTGGSRASSGMGFASTERLYDGTMAGRFLAAVALAAFSAGCASTTNYPDPVGPRYAGAYAKAATPREHALRVVTFNVKFAQHPAEAAALIRDNPRLAGADVIMLQEMDEAGTELVAR